jgi:hypothetical protein
VYLKRQKGDSMDPRVGRIILRTVQLETNGRLRVLLEGRDCKRINDHVETCAPCYNPNIYLWQNPQLASQDLDQACQFCRKTSKTAGGRMVCFCLISATRGGI